MFDDDRVNTGASYSSDNKGYYSFKMLRLEGVFIGFMSMRIERAMSYSKRVTLWSSLSPWGQLSLHFLSLFDH